MNILITSGGTSERIDNVRRITNSSTGRLGLAVAEAFAAEGGVAKIWYVCGLKAVRPQLPKVETIPVESADDLQRTVTEICGSGTVDAVVHAMAVSDYTVGAVTTVAAVADSVELEMGRFGADAPKDGARNEPTCLHERLAIAVKGASTVAHGSKISSEVDDLVLLLRKTPKVLAGFRAMLPKGVIVGFKLLDRVTEDFLIGAAHDLLLKNDCDFVLANDLRDIGESGHVGRLVRKDKSYETFHTKEEIAGGIVAAVMRHKT
ncbi:MAG: phosphopantothenate--cysteine ligase [Clostridiales Family XIII bacterium]|nr:phosphopantothenate--cysteine ligase [Clostridiales Family XIII bacterium]